MPTKMMPVDLGNRPCFMISTDYFILPRVLSLVDYRPSAWKFEE